MDEPLFILKCTAFVSHPCRRTVELTNGILCCHSCPKYEGCRNRCGNMVHRCEKSSVEEWKRPEKKRKERKTLKKRIIQFDKDNNLVATYDSLTEASDITGVSKTNISLAANYRQKLAGGFIWRYESDKPEEREPNGKPVGQFSRTGELLDKFPSVREAAKALETTDMCIYHAISGQRKSYKGFLWRYLDE